MSKRRLLFSIFLIGIVILGITIAYYPIVIDLHSNFSEEVSSPFGELLKSHINTTLAYVIPFLSKWTSGGADANYINYDIQFSLTAQNVLDSFDVSVSIKAVRNDNGNYKVIFSKSESRTGLADGSETWSYSGSYDVPTLLETDLGCSQSGSYQIDFYISFTITATGSITGQTLSISKTYTLFQSITFDWTPDTQYVNFEAYDTANWRYWASSSLDPSTAPNYIQQEDSNSYYVASDPGDQIYMYFHCFIDTTTDWTPTLILTFRFDGGAEFDITTYQDYEKGLILYDWQAGSYVVIDKPLPTSYTQYQYNLLDYTLDWFDTSTGEVRVGFEYFAHDAYLRIDYMVLELSPYSASWTTYIPMTLSGVVIGVAVAVFLMNEDQRLRKILLVIIAISSALAVLLSFVG